MSRSSFDRVGPEGDVVDVDGVRLFVRRLGDPALPPLVVIHGGPTWDHSYLLPPLERLTTVAHVVVFDLRGCGRSDRTAPRGRLSDDQLQPDLLADDVAALIRALGVPRADVLGFSFGGRIALRVVEQHPDAVRRLVLASTTAYQDFQEELHASTDYQQRRASTVDIAFDDPQLTGPDADDGALSRAMAFAGAPLQIWRLERIDTWHRVLARVRFTSDYNRPYWTGALRPAGPEHPLTVLRNWNGRLLIVQGTNDLVFPVGVARRLHADIAGSVLVEIPDAGHMAHFDSPDAWVAAVESFLAAD